MQGSILLVLLSASLACQAPPKLVLTPTIHCCGIRITGVPAEIVGADVRFRQEGAGAWNEALPLVVALGNRAADSFEQNQGETRAAWVDDGPIIRRLHGSIFWLQPQTVYEIQLTLRNAAGATQETLAGRTKTLADAVVYGHGRTLNVGQDAVYKTIGAALKEARPGDTVRVPPGVYHETLWLPDWPSGEPGNPIVIRAEKGAILDGEGVADVGNVHGGIQVQSAHDLVIEGFLIRRFKYCMFVNACRRVAVQRNFIDLTLSARSAPYGIRLKRCTDCLVQFNSLREPKPGEHDYARYPLSIDGGQRNIIRYNQMLGGACHDILTARNNHDTDIYENVFRGRPADDGVELEGGACINLRFFNNVLDCADGQKATVSVTPVTVGPVYVVRNVFVCSQQVLKFANDGTIKDLKAGRRMCDFAPLLFYHNVFYQPKDQFFRFLGCHGRPILVNNIITGQVLPNVTKNLEADRATHFYARVEADHNVYWDGGKTMASPTPGLDLHSLYADPLLMDAENGDFRLRQGSPAIDKACRLPNINDTLVGKAPDIGAFEYDSNWTGRTLQRPLDDDPR